MSLQPHSENDQNPATSSPDAFSGPPLASRVHDPVAALAERIWRPVLLVVGALVAGWYIKSTLSSSYEQSAREAADSFSKVRTAFTSVKTAQERLRTLEATSLAGKSDVDVKKQADDVERAKKEVSEAKDLLSQFLVVLGDAREPYKQLASIYRALAAREVGDIAAMRAALSTFSAEPVGKPDSSERFYAELGLLALAKTLIDDPATLNEGRDLLIKLSKNGTTVDVTAALSVARIAETSEQRAAAVALLTDLQTGHPEQAALLERELKRLK